MNRSSRCAIPAQLRVTGPRGAFTVASLWWVVGSQRASKGSASWMDKDSPINTQVHSRTPVKGCRLSLTVQLGAFVAEQYRVSAN